MDNVQKVKLLEILPRMTRINAHQLPLAHGLSSQQRRSHLTRNG